MLVRIVGQASCLPDRPADWMPAPRPFPGGLPTMRRFLKSSSPLLLAAGMLARTCAATAQEVLLPPLRPAPTTAAGPVLPAPVRSDSAAPPLLAPLPAPATQTAPPISTTGKPRLAVFAADRPGAGVDLLVVPAVPS